MASLPNDPSVWPSSKLISRRAPSPPRLGNVNQSEASDMNLSLSSSTSSSSLSSASSSSASSSAGSWFSGIVRGRTDRSGSVKTGSNSISAGAGDHAGPVVRKNQFRGVLFKYGPKPIQVSNAFRIRLLLAVI